jgi:hypothetical protein
MIHTLIAVPARNVISQRIDPEAHVPDTTIYKYAKKFGGTDSVLDRKRTCN